MIRATDVDKYNEITVHQEIVAKKVQEIRSLLFCLCVYVCFVIPFSAPFLCFFLVLFLIS